MYYFLFSFLCHTEKKSILKGLPLVECGAINAIMNDKSFFLKKKELMSPERQIGDKEGTAFVYSRMLRVN